MAMTYSSRFWLYAPTAAFLLIAVAVMAYWWVAAGAFEKKLAALKGHEAIPGVTLNWSKVEVGGFPFRLDADFINFTATGAGAHGPLAWSAAKFAAHTLSYNRDKIVYEAAGQQMLIFTGKGGGVMATAFLPASMRASSIIDPKGLRRFDLDIVGVGAKAFTIGHFQFHVRRDPDGADLDLMLKTDATRIKGGAPENQQVYATLSRADAFAPLLAGTMSWPEAARNWQEEGGKAKLSQIAFSGKGTVVAPQLLLEALY